ncbi:hypothetical protein B0H10DRAFT_2432300 [Mycena sp. CBHHK59/15]|nr:hypothetical protein B0H10DRAFT_2432300 [Mycena sp. CBHHK59/15]
MLASTHSILRVIMTILEQHIHTCNKNRNLKFSNLTNPRPLVFNFLRALDMPTMRELEGLVIESSTRSTSTLNLRSCLHQKQAQREAEHTVGTTLRRTWSTWCSPLLPLPPLTHAPTTRHPFPGRQRVPARGARQLTPPRLALPVPLTFTPASLDRAQPRSNPTRTTPTQFASSSKQRPNRAAGSTRLCSTAGIWRAWLAYDRGVLARARIAMHVRHRDATPSVLFRTRVGADTRTSSCIANVPLGGAGIPASAWRPYTLGRSPEYQIEGPPCNQAPRILLLHSVKVSQAPAVKMLDYVLLRV